MLRRLLPIAAAFALIAGGVVVLSPDLRELLGTAAGSPRSGAATHELYSTGKVTSRCEVPRMRDEISEEDLVKALRSLAPCLDRSWAEVLGSAGYDYEPPGEVNLVRSPEEAACGKDDDDWSGIYCPESNSVNVLIDDNGWAFYTMFTLAHEYAHHVQEISGIADQRGPEVFDEAWSRRLELQADCLAAVSLRGIEPEPVDQMGDADGAQADDQDLEWAKHRESHGSASSSAAWIRLGMREGTIGACNTWAAPEERVS
ncbi:neutral zinc metallopeptidase [Streptosporangium soli]|nr:neutral zinc metallopeptidase [Streptosporangium sp. KLBMP 9127]